MKNRITNLFKNLVTNIVVTLFMLAPLGAWAQNKACDARFEIKTDGYKIAVAALGNSGGDYFWSFGDGAKATKPNAEHTYQKEGVYVVCLVVKKNNGNTSNFRGCADTICKRVEIKDPCKRLQADFRFKQEEDKAYFESTTDGSNLQYEWLIEGRKVSTDKGFRFNFPKPGKYTVCLVVKIKGTRCVSRECKVIKVLPANSCAKLNATFGYRQQENKALFTSTTKGRNLVYEWTINGRKVSEKEGFRFTFKEPGRYNVCLTVKIKGTRCVKQVCKVVGVKRPEPCRLTARFRYVVDGHKVAFKNLSKGNNLDYLWTIDGKCVSGREHYITELRPGKYKVCLTITNRNGRCKETFCAEVVIAPKRTISKNTPLTTSGEETAAGAINTTGEAAQNPAQEVSISVFPNPVQDVLSVSVTWVENTTVIVSNLNGLVYYNAAHTITPGQVINLPISHLPQGYYVAKVVSASGTTTQQKFYKQ